MEQLFTQALGLTAPWAVTGFDFRPAEGAIHFTAECQASRLPCPACGAADQPIHDRLPRRWQHLHFFQFKAYIEARVPRVACSQCNKTSQCEVPWSRPGSGFSAVMEAFVIALCQGMPVAQVARLLGVSDERVWRVLEHYIPKARTAESMASMSKLAVDETSSRRGAFISVFFDAEQRRLVYATPGRNAATFKSFAEDLRQRGGAPAAITDISMDMSKAFQAGARAQCPQAQISFDPFHVVQLASTALDQVRRAETKRAPELKGSRWALLKSSKKWSPQQIQTMHHLQRSGLQTARAWRLKEALRQIFRDATTRAEAEPLLRAWIGWARRCRLAPFKRVGQTLKDHLEGILGHFSSGLSNGFLESMNGLIQAAKSRARGYRTDQRLILVAYLVCGKLKHLPSNPWLTPASTTA
jgi:transposase